MRILLSADPEIPVPPEFYGGVQRLVDGLVREFRSRGHSVGLIAHPNSSSEVDAFFAWKGLASQNRLDTFKNITVLRSALGEFCPDLLHSFSRLLYMLPVLPTKLPKVMTYERYPGKKQVCFGSFLARSSLTYTGCSEYICNLGRRGGGHWKCVYNFVDIERFEFQSRVPADAPLVFLSRIEPIKGAHIAIEAARQAGVPLLLAGNHSEVGMEGAYWHEQIAPQLGKDGIEYVGAVNDQQKNELLRNARAMIVPIQWDEPFGIVFAESLACGTPVISCPRGALPEIVRHETEGYHVQNVTEAIAAIERLGDIDRRLCRRRVEEKFTRQVVTDHFLELYHSMHQINLDNPSR